MNPIFRIATMFRRRIAWSNEERNKRFDSDSLCPNHKDEMNIPVESLEHLVDCPSYEETRAECLKLMIKRISTALHHNNIFHRPMCKIPKKQEERIQFFETLLKLEKEKLPRPARAPSEDLPFHSGNSLPNPIHLLIIEEGKIRLIFLRVVNDRLEGGKSDPHWTENNRDLNIQTELMSAIQEIGLQPEKEVWYFSSMGRIPEITYRILSQLLCEVRMLENTIISLLTTIIMTLYKIWKIRNLRNVSNQLIAGKKQGVDPVILNDGLELEELWDKISLEYQKYVDDFRNQVQDTTSIFPEEPLSDDDTSD
jgi:hypothetical protein